MSLAPISPAAPIAQLATAAARSRRPTGTIRPSRNFLADLVKKLDAAVEQHQVKSLIVVAPPRALGMIRPLYSQALRAAVRFELDKDFVKMPVHEIEKHLTAA